MKTIFLRGNDAMIAQIGGLGIDALIRDQRGNGDVDCIL